MLTHRAFGVEQEHFVFHDDGTPPSPEEIDHLWSRLQSDGFQIRAVDAHNAIISLEKATPWGPLVITNDSCTHIIEIAFPPLQDLTIFRQMYLDAWGIFLEHALTFGLAIHFGAALPRCPSIIHWRPKETDINGTRLKSFLDRKPLDHPLFVEAFPACFTATHVSLNIPQEEAIRQLPALYNHEYLIPLFCSNSFDFQGARAHCIRPLAWMANFQHPYPLLGIPSPLPVTLLEYEQMRQLSPFRDYSFIAIRSANRVEFRSACSQDSVDKVVRLIELRLAIEAKVALDKSGAGNPGEIFFKCCESGGVGELFDRQAKDFHGLCTQNDNSYGSVE